MYREDLELQTPSTRTARCRPTSARRWRRCWPRMRGRGAMLDAYRKLERPLADDRAARPLAVRWDRLAERISSSFAEHADSEGRFRRAGVATPGMPRAR